MPRWARKFWANVAPVPTADFMAACNGEIDIIAAGDVDDEIIAELDEWAEIGWILLECGCLISPELLQCKVRPGCEICVSS